MLVDKVKLTTALRAFTGKYDMRGVDSLLKQWGKSKKGLFELFGEKLKVEIPFKANVSTNDLHNLRRGFINENRHLFTSNMIWLLQEVSPNDVVGNTCNIGPFNIPFNFHEEYGISYNRGIKLSRLLSMMVEDEMDYIVINEKMKTKREWFDIQYSKFQQSLKSTGTLALSIDPIDFLTMSVNNSGWRSCHHAQDGEYRGGCLSYMVDSVTAVAYVYNGKEVSYGSFQHNSKNWRQMVFIDLDRKGAILSRQYPREDRFAVEELIEVIGNQFKERFDLHDGWDISSDEDDIQNSVEDCYDHLHYSDINNGCEATMLRMNVDGLSYSRKLDIMVGDKPTCPLCGDDDVENSESLSCDDCDNTVYCHCCDSRTSDFERGPDGDRYCRRCYENNFTPCHMCGDMLYSEDATSNYEGEAICEYCFVNHCAVCEECGETHNRRHMERLVDCRVCTPCFESEYNTCDRCGTVYHNNDMIDGECNSCHNISISEGIEELEEVS